jgi:hypothetical protein
MPLSHVFWWAGDLFTRLGDRNARRIIRNRDRSWGGRNWTGR